MIKKGQIYAATVEGQYFHFVFMLDKSRRLLLFTLCCVSRLIILMSTTFCIKASRDFQGTNIKGFSRNGRFKIKYLTCKSVMRTRLTSSCTWATNRNWRHLVRRWMCVYWDWKWEWSCCARFIFSTRVFITLQRSEALEWVWYPIRIFPKEKQKCWVPDYFERTKVIGGRHRIFPRDFLNNEALTVRCVIGNFQRSEISIRSTFLSVHIKC